MATRDRPTDARATPPGPPEAIDHKLTLALPAAVVRELRLRMAAENTTVRALVLEALQAAGYAVPVAEIRDRRRARTAPGRRP